MYLNLTQNIYPILQFLRAEHESNTQLHFPKRKMYPLITNVNKNSFAQYECIILAPTGMGMMLSNTRI